MVGGHVASFGVKGLQHPCGVSVAPRWRRSVLAGQQQRGDAAIPFGDDPELQAGCDLVGREQAILTGLQRGIVLPPVAVVEVAPIAAEVATQVGNRVELACWTRSSTPQVMTTWPGEKRRLGVWLMESAWAAMEGSWIWRGHGTPSGRLDPGGWKNRRRTVGGGETISEWSTPRPAWRSPASCPRLG